MNKEYFFRGQPFKQFPDLVPEVGFLYSDFEKDFNADPYLKWTRENYWFPFSAVTIYLFWCYFSSKFMEDRTKFDLKYPLAYWNLLLSLFSTYGMIRTVPHMLYNLSHYSFQETVCLHPSEQNWGCGATGFAVMLFIFSKIPELIDTVFITLRKRELIFLHWYHHFTVLLFCWNAYSTESGAGLYFVSMNYTVHAIMYFYYYLMAIKVVPSWFPAWIITLLQISQMIVGTFVVGAGIYYKEFAGGLFDGSQSPAFFTKYTGYVGVSCSNDDINMLAGLIMYGSYLLLFMEFAFGRYIWGTRGRTRAPSDYSLRKVEDTKKEKDAKKEK